MDSETKNRKVILYTFIEVVCILIICIVGNMFDWLNLKFKPEKIMNWDYWNGVIQQTIMYSASLVVGYFSRLEKLELNSPEYFKLLETYRELLKSKKDSFTKYINTVYNQETKKKFIKLRTKKKLYKLDKRSKDEWKLEFQKALDSGELESYKFKNPKSLKYFKTRIKLESLIKDSYIDANINSISINYPRVSAESFTYTLRIHMGERSMYKTENEIAKELPMNLLKKIAMGLLSAAIIGFIMWDPNVIELSNKVDGWIAVVLKYLLRVFIIFVNLLLGVHSGSDSFDSNFILPIDNRNRILMQYIDWAHNNGEKDTYADNILETYNKQKELKDKLEKQVKSLESINKE